MRQLQGPCLSLSRILLALPLILVLLAVDSGIRVLHAEEPDAEIGSSASSLLDNLFLSGYLKNETAFRFREPRSITKMRNIAQLNAQYSLGPDYQLVFSGRAYHDLAYELFAYETISARFARDSEQPLVFIENLAQEKDSPVAEIRELYLDIFFDRLDLRIGKQFVVWGVFEGIRITDEVNPLDFRELILLDLLDYRVPQWTFRADYYADNSSFQLIWIPDIQFHKPAPPGSEWELLQDIVTPEGEVVTQYPSRTLRNSEIGLRMSTDILGADISFSYLYTWDAFPVIFRSAQIDSVLEPEFFPTYTRINMYGATLTRPAGRGIVKAEMAFVPDKYFGLMSDTDRTGDGFLDDQGAVQKRHVRWGLGYDFNLWGTEFSPAITQWVILDYDEQLIQDEFDTSLTLFVRRPLPQYGAVFQLLAIGLVNLEELYLRPKMIFNVTNHFQIAAGADLFYGRQSQFGSAGGAAALIGADAVEQAQFFGNFTDNDRIFLEFRYSF